MDFKYQQNTCHLKFYPNFILFIHFSRTSLLPPLSLLLPVHHYLSLPSSKFLSLFSSIIRSIIIKVIYQRSLITLLLPVFSADSTAVPQPLVLLLFPSESWSPFVNRLRLPPTATRSSGIHSYAPLPVYIIVTDRRHALGKPFNVGAFELEF